MKAYKKPKVLSAAGSPALVPALIAAKATTLFAAGVAAGLGLSSKGDKLSEIKITPLKRVEQMI